MLASQSLFLIQHKKVMAMNATPKSKECFQNLFVLQEDTLHHRYKHQSSDHV
jgi:hypothetical protein